MALTATQKQALEQVISLLNQADELLQATIPHSDDLYYIHTQIENAADDVTDMIVGEEA